MIYQKRFYIPPELKNKTLKEVSFCEECWTAYPLEELEYCDCCLTRRLCIRCIRRLKRLNKSRGVKCRVCSQQYSYRNRPEKGGDR